MGGSCSSHEGLDPIGQTIFKPLHVGGVPSVHEGSDLFSHTGCWVTLSHVGGFEVGFPAGGCSGGVADGSSDGVADGSSAGVFDFLQQGLDPSSQTGLWPSHEGGFLFSHKGSELPSHTGFLSLSHETFFELVLGYFRLGDRAEVGPCSFGRFRGINDRAKRSE